MRVPLQTEPGLCRLAVPAFVLGVSYVLCLLLGAGLGFLGSSLVLPLVALMRLATPLVPIVTVTLSLIAAAAIRRSRGKPRGMGLAVAALGALPLLLWVLTRLTTSPGPVDSP